MNKKNSLVSLGANGPAGDVAAVGSRSAKELGLARQDPPDAFAVKDCALVAVAIGRRAQSLRELKGLLRDIHPDSIYHHFWGVLLRPRFSDRDLFNDFAAWALHSLHDQKLAERLAMIDPTDYTDLEALRSELMEVIDERLDEVEVVPTAAPGDYFLFLRSTIVVFDTGKRVSKVSEFPAAVGSMSTSSVFYHFIDARRRTEGGLDDFRAWLRSFGKKHEELCRRLAGIDPYFDSLYDLRARLVSVLTSYLG
jgi:hypothetical protein